MSPGDRATEEGQLPHPAQRDPARRAEAATYQISRGGGVRGGSYDSGDEAGVQDVE